MLGTNVMVVIKGCVSAAVPLQEKALSSLHLSPSLSVNDIVYVSLISGRC